MITYIDRVCISFAAPAIRDELHLSVEQLGWVFPDFQLVIRALRNSRRLPGRLDRPAEGPDADRDLVVLLHRCHGLGVQFRLAAGDAFHVRRGGSGMLPESDEGLYDLAAGKRARARAGNYVAQRAVGRRVHSAAGGARYVMALPRSVHPEYGWRPAFTVFGCLGVVWAVVFYTWFRDSPFENPKMNASERELIAKDGVSATAPCSRPVGRAAGVASGLDALLAVFLPLVRLVFLRDLAADVPQGGPPPGSRGHGAARHLAAVRRRIGYPVSVFVGNRLMREDRHIVLSRRIIACIGFTGASGFLVYSTTFSDPAYAVAAIALASFCNDLVMPHAWASAMDIGGKYAGTLSGAMNFWGNVGGGSGR